MTEDEARSQASEIAGAAMVKLERYAGLLIAENGRQNLIARSTEPMIWTRHLLDSLQLTRFARPHDRTLVDVGSGPGLPGLVLGMLERWQVTLVEPRRRRCDFLSHVVGELKLASVTVVGSSISALHGRHDLVTARAVAPVGRLLELTAGCTDERTRFILPKGRTARDDVDLAQRRWHGLFHVEHSITDERAGIVIAEGVRAR